MTTIHVLPEELINQIAAGEVIENPASVVKELIENALDAKSQTIVVRIKAGGLYQIIVEDDGKGMSLEDALLCIERYATSKIQSMDDLQKVQTMGFRGEALSSIAAISKMTIETSNGNTANLISLEAGKIVSTTLSSRTKGTTITVASLFYTVPVRKKFQKSYPSLVAEISRMIIKLSLSHPHLSFSLFSDDKCVLETKAYPQMSYLEALKETIHDVLGEDFFSQLIPVSYQDALIKIEGFIGLETLAKKTRGSQYLFINQRSIYSHNISQIIHEGYNTRISKDFHPSFVLNLNLPYAYVDVNVHPQKREVRIRDEFVIKEKILLAIRDAFTKKTTPEIAFHHENETFTATTYPAEYSVNHNVEDQKKSFLSFENEMLFSYPTDLNENFILFSIDPYVFVRSNFLSGSMHETMIVDLNKAAFRVLMDDYQKEKGLESETLALPVLIELDIQEMNLFLQNENIFKKFSLACRQVGKTTLAVDACPSFLPSKELKGLILAILENYEEDAKNILKEQMEKKVLKSLGAFCLKRKEPYSVDEKKALLLKWKNSSNPHLDPVGSKITKILEKEDIELLFKK